MVTRARESFLEIYFKNQKNVTIDRAAKGLEEHVSKDPPENQSSSSLLELNEKGQASSSMTFDVLYIYIRRLDDFSVFHSHNRQPSHNSPWTMKASPLSSLILILILILRLSDRVSLHSSQWTHLKHIQD